MHINIKFLRIVTFFAILCTGISCQTTNQMGSVNENGDNYMVISMKKTPCYGSCPVYEIEIYSNLEVKYKGERFVDKTGAYNSRISTSQLEDLKTAFNDAGFFEMEDEYVSSVTDLPTTYVFFSDGKKSKKIKDYTGAPEALKLIESKIAELLETQKWVKSED